MKAASICGLCYKVTGFDNAEEVWHDLPLFLSLHKVQLKDLRLLHGYCPTCRFPSKKRKPTLFKDKDIAA
jgi:hypothetical protein